MDKGNIVNPNTWITLELSNTDNFRHIYVRRKFANRIAINDCAHTPMEARNMDNDITYNFRTRELTMLFYKCRPINTHAYYDTIDTAFEWVDRIKRFFEDLEENDD